MRITVATCTAIYTGRGDTKLEKAVRAIIIKDDGSVSIHNDKSNKPLNYMGKGNVFTETHEDGNIIWNFDTRKESLRIEITAILQDSNFIIDLDDAGLIRDGTEKQLQEWLAANPETLGEGYTLDSREYLTGAGPVDLLVYDKEGTPIAVEVKRVAMLGAVDQATRYVQALRETPGFENAQGLIAALDIRPNTIKLADKRGIKYITLPEDWKKVIEIEEAILGVEPNPDDTSVSE